MIQSMTGFASQLFVLNLDAQNKTNVSLSLKTLNSRFFEASCKLPPALSHLETTFLKILKKRLHRGCMYLTIHLDNPSIFKGSVQPALNTVKSYLHAIELIKKECKISDPISLENILNLSHVFTLEEKTLDEQHAEHIIKVLEEVIVHVIEARIAEGHAMREDLSQRLAQLRIHIEIITKRSQEQVEEQKHKVNTLVAELPDDENKLADVRKNALYAVLDKIDVHEEIVRFKSHLEAIQAILDKPDASDNGKRLDFTLQELGREINTIAAKCSDATISKHAINAKVEIEKAREQAQNIV